MSYRPFRVKWNHQDATDGSVMSDASYAFAEGPLEALAVWFNIHSSDLQAGRTVRLVGENDVVDSFIDIAAVIDAATVSTHEAEVTADNGRIQLQAGPIEDYDHFEFWLKLIPKHRRPGY